MIKIGIDQSLRSTGISILRDNELIENFIYQPTEKCYEQLITDSINFYCDLFEDLHEKYHIDTINLESLSFNSVSSSKDVIATCHWNLRCILYNMGYQVNIVSPAQWRKFNQIIPKNKKQKELKQEIGKDYLKILAWDKLDVDTQDKIMLFCKKNKLKKKSGWDLTESYWIGRFEK